MSDKSGESTLRVTFNQDAAPPARGARCQAVRGTDLRVRAISPIASECDGVVITSAGFSALYISPNALLRDSRPDKNRKAWLPNDRKPGASKHAEITKRSTVAIAEYARFSLYTGLILFVVTFSACEGWT